MPNMAPRLSVVVACRDRPVLLRGALDAIRQHLTPGDEAIVVDSASRSNAIGEVGRAAGVRVLRLDRPGTSRARNAGWQAAGAPLVAFIDDDCLITRGWGDGLVSAFSDQTVGFVTGRVEADRAESVTLSVFLDDARRRFEQTADPATFGGGSNMAFRRSAITAVGGFDEGMGPGTALRAAEDQDLFWRVVRAGWAGVYDPEIVVTHRQWRTRGQAIRRQVDYGVGAAAVAVKAIRLGDPEGWQYLRDRLWRQGFALAGRSFLEGYESGAVAQLLRVAGVVGGALLAWARPMTTGHYRP
jgi:cellulose synthase/poly-beta-1,6-N-acetylglucosamine synthase-like glycosyltransferase